MLQIVPTNILSALPLLSSPLLDILTSGVAVIIYLVILLVTMVAIILVLLFRDSAAPKVVAAPVEEAEEEKPEAEEEETTAERFCMLSEIDRRSAGYGHQSYDQSVTLESFCRDFRNKRSCSLKPH